MSSALRIAPAIRMIAVAAVALGSIAACTSSGSGTPDPSVTTSPTAAPATSAPVATSAVVPTTSSAPTTTAPPLGKPVSLSSVEGDGQTYGIGMPLIIRFDGANQPTSKAAFEKAAVVTVNNKPAGGAWFWEKPYADGGEEAHYRPQTYWPANSQIHVGLKVKGLSAGTGLSFANDLTLDYAIGASHFSRVDAQKLTMTVYSGGKVVKVIRVSLGKSTTPTEQGTKVVMQKNNPVRMIGPGYNELVNWSVRMTTSGEYVHAAPWNGEIGAYSTSNGCTNLHVADAQWFYNFSNIGDIVQYPNASGQVQPVYDGYGDWNVNWNLWLAGGNLQT
jgi:lipoprotein-anchoring transpeptidase ErfK/SrfK